MPFIIKLLRIHLTILHSTINTVQIIAISESDRIPLAGSESDRTPLCMCTNLKFEIINLFMVR